MEAMKGLFTPALASMTEAEQSRRQYFNLYDRNARFRIPQGHAVRTCSLGFDIQDGNSFTFRTSWQELQGGMLSLLRSCIGYSGGVGGTSAQGGIIYAFTNPEQVSGLGTCLAPRPPLGLQRLNLAQCLITHGSTPRQGLVGASAVVGFLNRYSSDAASRGSGPNQIAQAVASVPMQPALPNAPVLQAPSQARVVDGSFFPRPPDGKPGRLRRFAWRGTFREPENVFWRTFHDGRLSIVEMWKSAGGWCTVKLRGPTVIFPLQKPPKRTGPYPYGVPHPFLLPKPGQRAKTDLAWVWKSSGTEWIPYYGNVPLGDEYFDTMEDRYGRESGWFLIKWAFP